MIEERLSVPEIESIRANLQEFGIVPNAVAGGIGCNMIVIDPKTLFSLSLVEAAMTPLGFRYIAEKSFIHPEFGFYLAFVRSS